MIPPPDPPCPACRRCLIRRLPRPGAVVSRSPSPALPSRTFRQLTRPLPAPSRPAAGWKVRRRRPPGSCAAAGSSGRTENRILPPLRARGSWDDTMRRPSQKASAVSFTSVAAVVRTSGGSRSSTAARARYRTRMPVNSPPSPVPSQRSTVALRPISGAGRVRLRATAATSAEARARLVSPPSSSSAPRTGPLVVGVDGALQHHVAARSDPQAVLVHALFGVEKPGIEPVQQGLRPGRLAGAGVVERHGRRGRGVLEVPFLAPEGAAAQVVRGGGIELQGEALQDLGVAAASRPPCGCPRRVSPAAAWTSASQAMSS